jgi:protein LTV1
VSHITSRVAKLIISQATYTNLENHPRLIKAREERKVPMIRLDPKTGFPVVDGKFTSRSNVSSSLPDKAAGASRFDRPSQLVNPIIAPRTTARRPREESAEERRERKRTVKAEKQARRIEKKEKREQFSIALKQQSQVLARKDAQVRKL